MRGEEKRVQRATADTQHVLKEKEICGGTFVFHCQLGLR